jgi:protein-S-isoprenylcysteine O-methyltransferase Ste14
MQMTTDNNYAKGISLAGIRIGLYLAFTGAVLFASYGSLKWERAWLLLGIWVVYHSVMILLGGRVNPDVVLERATTGTHSPNPWWDRVILGLNVLGLIAVNVVTGLDAGRFGWASVPEWLAWSMLAVAVLANLLPLWAVLVNPFASSVVRIQAERGHYAVSAGPYRYVRHPMYLGGLLYPTAYPLFLGSYWALVPGLLVAGLLIVRTHLEDMYLQDNLEGYKAYADQVRWRLLPGVW